MHAACSAKHDARFAVHDDGGGAVDEDADGGGDDGDGGDDDGGDDDGDES